MPSRRYSANRYAFTLVELLVVIGIIALLISILLPVLSRARESGNRVACLGNLRQVGIAMVAFAVDNKGYLPAPGEVGPGVPEDWVYWQKARQATKEQGRIWRYLGGYRENVLHCPSDDQARLRILLDPYGPSYTMNMLLSTKPGLAKYFKITEINRASEMYLMVDEDERSLDDGNFNPLCFGTNLENYLATRHDRQLQGVKARGNVSFADGHADYVSREYTQNPAHYDPSVP